METATFPADGVYCGLKTSVYHAVRCDRSQPLETQRVSKSLLHKFAQNPHLWLIEPKKEPTAAMQWGSLVDSLLLTPEEMDELYHVRDEAGLPSGHAARVAALLAGAELVESPFDSFRTKEAREWKAEQEAAGNVIAKADEIAIARQEAEALRAGKSIIKPELYALALEAVGELEADSEAYAILKDSDTQVMLMATTKEPNTGHVLPISAMLDFVPHVDSAHGDKLGDLKTMGVMDSEEKIWEQCYKLGYFKQAALSIDLWNMLTDEERTGWILIIQRSAPPFDVVVKHLSAEEIQLGRNGYAADLRTWCECVTTGNFPDPRRATEEFSRPAWGESLLLRTLSIDD